MLATFNENDYPWLRLLTVDKTENWLTVDTFTEVRGNNIIWEH